MSHCGKCGLNRSYDVFGKLTSQSNELSGAHISHGYTGHEHDTEHGLINMGGRIYDPTLARFLSADPFVQAPYFSEGLNRYSYVWNNPLRYIDPSGYNTEDAAPVSDQSFDVMPHDTIIGPVSSQSNDSGWDADITGTSLNTSTYVPNVLPPSLGRSLIPIYGSKQDADYNFSESMNAYFDDGEDVSAAGFLVLGLGYTALAAADVLTLGTVSALLKGGIKVVTKLPSLLKGGRNWLKGLLSRESAVVDPGKWNYIFGAAKGVKNAAHNGPRTAQNLQQMSRLGVANNPAGRELLQKHFNNVIKDPNNIVKKWTNKHGAFETRESLFAGPDGFSKFMTTWEVMANGARRFTTIIPVGGL
jgi:RHS repeat-associated protein